MPIGIIGAGLILWLAIGAIRGQLVADTLALQLAFLVIVLIVTAILVWLVFRPLRKVRRAGKETLLAGTCRFLGFTFEPSAAGFPLGLFYDNGVLEFCNRERRNDRISGSLDGVAFDFCELHLENREASGSGKRRRPRMRTVFLGQVATFVAPTTFRGRTLIARDSGRVGNFLSRVFSGRERVPIEAPDFEARYEVYSDDPADARALLGPELRACLLAIADELGTRPTVGLVGDRVLLAADTHEDRFEGSGLTAALDAEAAVRRLLIEVAVIFRMIETLELTPRRA
ncbi:MAG: DUF3137 domain-containing protein [Kiloniellales bacterium]